VRLLPKLKRHCAVWKGSKDLFRKQNDFWPWFEEGTVWCLVVQSTLRGLLGQKIEQRKLSACFERFITPLVGREERNFPKPIDGKWRKGLGMVCCCGNTVYGFCHSWCMLWSLVMIFSLDIIFTLHSSLSFGRIGGGGVRDGWSGWFSHVAHN